MSPPIKGFGMGAAQPWLPLGGSGDVAATPCPTPRAQTLSRLRVAVGVLVPPGAASSGANGGAYTCAWGVTRLAPPAQPHPRFTPPHLINGFVAGHGWASQSRCVRLPILVLHSPASHGESAPWVGFGRFRSGSPHPLRIPRRKLQWSACSLGFAGGTSFKPDGT